jgi:steroid 5-alpha reductase family enzyme
MLLWYVVAQVRQRNDVADIAWGGGFAVAALAALVTTPPATGRAWLATGLVSVWGLRLAVHIARRSRGRGEDPRYRAWRQTWGRHAAVRALLQVFLLQGALILLISLPVLWLVRAPARPPGVLDALGATVWLAGFLVEAVADRQLARFRRTAALAGRVLQTGLWRYSRHPNYFGEVTLWWGVYVMALGVPGGWRTVVGPVTITVLILGVSGIPLLERRYRGNLEYEAYRRRTSAFVLWPPRR